MKNLEKIAAAGAACFIRNKALERPIPLSALVRDREFKTDEEAAAFRRGYKAALAKEEAAKEEAALAAHEWPEDWAESFIKALPNIRKDTHIFEGGYYGRHAGQFHQCAHRLTGFMNILMGFWPSCPSGADFTRTINAAEKAARAGDKAAFLAAWKNA